MTLSHDHVVREWIGPIALNGGHAEIKQAVTTRSTWNTTQLGVVGFVQATRTGTCSRPLGRPNVCVHDGEHHATSFGRGRYIAFAANPALLPCKPVVHFRRFK